MLKKNSCETIFVYPFGIIRNTVERGAGEGYKKNKSTMEGDVGDIIVENG